MYIRVAKKQLSPWPSAKESLSDVGFEKILFFFNLFTPDPEIEKKPLRGFSEILLHNIS